LQSQFRNALLLMLTAAAGSTDAIAYLGLGRVFTANMTGNLVLLGVAIGQGQLSGSIRSSIAFVGFAVSFFVGVRMRADQEGSIWPRSVTRALFVELGLLVALTAEWEIAGGQPGALALDMLIVLSAGAMGMQSAATRRLAVAGESTTFVTGMLTGLIAELAGVSSDRSHWTLWAATLACLVIGAAGGGAVFISWRSGAPLVAVLLVGIVAAAAMWLSRTSHMARI
jgi:uncharacterized membrane protein YoaK (UPF0700 family)